MHDLGQAVLPNETSPWRILIVDDEPDVHDVTRMLIGRMEFAGRRVVLDCVHSAAAAAARLETWPDTALILLDVVMETDDAGLRLVEQIRYRLGNRDVQIVLRTGQPGQAPEREVMLGYDINGYFLKTEITAQKLYSIIIAALRAYAYVQTLKQPRTRPARPRLSAEPLDALITRPFRFESRPLIDLRDGRIDGLALEPCWSNAPPIDWRCALSPDAARRFNRRLLVTAAGLHADRKVVEGVPLRLMLPLAFDPEHGDALLGALVEDLAESGLSGNGLRVALAEAQLPRQRPIDPRVLARLRSTGLSLVVDRFGSCRTAVAQLRQLRPDQLKIDRRLIAGVVTDPDSAAITRSLIALAHTLGMAVVADGVDTYEQCQFLKWEGCEFAQGDYFASG